MSVSKNPDAKKTRDNFFINSFRAALPHIFRLHRVLFTSDIFFGSSSVKHSRIPAFKKFQPSKCVKFEDVNKQHRPHRPHPWTAPTAPTAPTQEKNRRSRSTTTPPSTFINISVWSGSLVQFYSNLFTALWLMQPYLAFLTHLGGLERIRIT